MMRPFLLLAALLFALPSRALELTVFHTNDIHGWIMPRPAGNYGPDPERRIGGAAALASVYRKHSGLKLLLDGGDWFQGTPEGNVPEGMSLIDVFNAIPYDAVVVGNHDFDFSEKRLMELARASKIPVLSANIYRVADGKRIDYVRPWIVKKVGGVKVGIFGLTTSNLRNLVFPGHIEGLRVRREADEAREAVAALKKQGATVIIALTHVGVEGGHMSSFESDQFLAATVPGIDLIVGGHTHTPLRPAIRDATHGTLIVQAGSFLQAVGKATLTIDDKTKKVVRSTATLVDLWIDETGEDPKIAGLVARHAEAVSRVYDVVIATAAQALIRDNNAESSIGSWMSDCLREWARADVAVQNGGGIRADVAAGPVTVRHIFSVMPFDNYLVKLSMDGEALAAVLDHAVAKGKRMSQFSGVSFAYDRDAPPGKRVFAPRVGSAPLDPARRYSVVTSDFLVKGGDGFGVFSRAEGTEFTRTLVRDALRDCARAQGVIRAPQRGRIRPQEARRGP